MTTETTNNAFQDIIEDLKKGAQDVIEMNDRLAMERDSLLARCMILKRRLSVEQDLVTDFAVKLALCQEELEKYKAAALMTDPAVARELADGHGLDIAGVPV